jgi:hypothetical protein
VFSREKGMFSRDFRVFSREKGMFSRDFNTFSREKYVPLKVWGLIFNGVSRTKELRTQKLRTYKLAFRPKPLHFIPCIWKTR